MGDACSSSSGLVLSLDDPFQKRSTDSSDDNHKCHVWNSHDAVHGDCVKKWRSLASETVGRSKSGSKARVDVVTLRYRENLVHILTMDAASFAVSMMETLNNETLASKVVSWSWIRRPHHRAVLNQRTRTDDDTKKFSKTTAFETQIVETFRKLTPCSFWILFPEAVSEAFFQKCQRAKQSSQSRRRRQHEYSILKFHQFIYKGSTSRILPMDPTSRRRERRTHWHPLVIDSSRSWPRYNAKSSSQCLDLFSESSRQSLIWRETLTNVREKSLLLTVRFMKRRHVKYLTFTGQKLVSLC